MINMDMRLYNYFTLGEEDDYGMPKASTRPQGIINMAINTLNQSTENNVKYKTATYIGLTLANIDETFIIQYGEELLKVLYVNPKGRYKQVYMVNI